MSADDRVTEQRLAALEAELARLHGGGEARIAAELRARLIQVGAAARLGTPTEHSALLEQLVRTAMHVLRARAGSLYLVDEDSEELVFEVALPEQSLALRGKRFPLGQGVAGWVAATGQAIAIADVREDPRWAAEIGRVVAYAPQTMLALPLLLRGEVIGVLQLLDKDGGRPFPAADMETLGLFAEQAAVAIAQSRAVRGLSALLRGLLVDEQGQSTLSAPTWAFITATEASPEYRDMLRLAELLGEMSRQSEAGRRLALDVAGAIASYLRGSALPTSRLVAMGDQRGATTPAVEG